MKKIRKFSRNEKLLLVLFLVSIILVVSSWQRISKQVDKLFKIYTGKEINIQNKK